MRSHEWIAIPNSDQFRSDGRIVLNQIVEDEQKAEEAARINGPEAASR